MKIVEYEDVLVAVTIETVRGNIQLAVGSEFHDQTVVALEAWIKEDGKSIKVVYEDESFIWFDLPQDALVHRKYKRIAIDGPAETK